MEPLHITPDDIIDAFTAEGTEDDSPTFGHIRKGIRKFLGERHMFYTLTQLSDLLGVPQVSLRMILTPDQIAQVGSRPSPVLVMTSDLAFED